MPRWIQKRTHRHREITGRSKKKIFSQNNKSEVMRVGGPLASSLTAPSDCTDLQATQRSVGAKHQHATSILTKILLLFSCSENNKRMIFLTYYDHKKTMFFFLFFFAKKALFHAFLLFFLCTQKIILVFIQAFLSISCLYLVRRRSSLVICSTQNLVRWTKT